MSPPPARTAAQPAAQPAARPEARQRAVPALLGVPAAVAAALLLLPLAGLLAVTPWSRLTALLSAPDVLAALRLSVLTATTATVLATLLGVPLAWVLARGSFRGLALLRALVTLPLVLPPVVGGIALLLAYGRAGVVGEPLRALTGITLPFTTAAVVLAQVFVAMPFLVVAVEGALRAADRGLEEAAATLGAGRLAVLRRVTLPLLAPSAAAGAVLCWARALGEFGATITFAGNLPGTTQTLSSAAYLALQTDPDAAVALSLVLLAVSAGVLALLRAHWLRPLTSRSADARAV
ncbi:ABC transporter permease [Quadrisphaera sp. DSM 44207]|uniref:ABC transporter permease n=1 Tax=Quadrisphaera sp. DSM 44207 TaxID=1881057 RepID=UPI00088497EA|nr:ABC transporter permease [Quadrisphaera sp. DSM 44207]SDQ42894.1 molybdate transport system permease protein [Quadrisphaera sp. DSM 44207]